MFKRKKCQLYLYKSLLVTPIRCLTDISKHIFCMSLEFFQSLSKYSECLIAKKLRNVKDGHSVLVLTSSHPFIKSSLMLSFPCTIKVNHSRFEEIKTHKKLPTRSLSGQTHLIWFHFGLGYRTVGTLFPL